MPRRKVWSPLPGPEPGTLLIPLTQGKYALIDETTYPIIAPYAWCAVRAKDSFYAITSIRLGKDKTTRIYMHRLLLGLPEHTFGDHENGNSLDNRLINLRGATRNQNAQNRRAAARNQSGYKGVYLMSRLGSKRWRAQAKKDGRLHLIGYYETPEDAARAYDAKARELFGEFARLNFPD